MRKTTKSPGERIVKDIKRATRKHYSSEEKIRIVLDGLRGEDSIAELCRREGISQGIYYKWSKDFMEAGIAQCVTLLVRSQAVSLKALRGLLNEEASYRTLDEQLSRSLSLAKDAEERLKQS